MTLAELRARLDEIGNLSRDERDSLLNEAHRQLAVRAEWTRRSVSIGPTVAGQEAYTVPATIAQPLRVLVDDVVYDAADETTVRQIESGEMRIGSHSLWWIKPADEADTVALYPVPTTDGLAVTVTAIVFPDTLAIPADTPDTPPDFDRALVDYVRMAVAADPEARTFWEDRFDRHVERLRRRRYSRAGRAPVQMRVKGLTA